MCLSESVKYVSQCDLILDQRFLHVSECPGSKPKLRVNRVRTKRKWLCVERISYGLQSRRAFNKTWARWERKTWDWKEDEGFDHWMPQWIDEHPLVDLHQPLIIYVPVCSNFQLWFSLNGLSPYEGLVFLVQARIFQTKPKLSHESLKCNSDTLLSFSHPHFILPHTLSTIFHRTYARSTHSQNLKEKHSSTYYPGQKNWNRHASQT